VNGEAGIKRTVKRRQSLRDPAGLAGIHPVLRRVYAARDICSVEQVEYPLRRLLPWNLLGNIDRAVDLLAGFLEQGGRIVIVADYDADGATACALAIRGLSAMGAEHVDYLVPDRFKHGYGLSPAVVELALGKRPDAIITVDNGISSIDGVALARAHGIQVIITDHHLPGRMLPQADAIVNPNLPGDPFPSKCLAGVGVMFYLLVALRACLRDRGWFARKSIEEPNLGALLDLVALGTVADVVPLDYNNRILVAGGLARIRNGRSIPGINALFRAAGRDTADIVAGDLGFVAGPRLNAAGRLTDMSLGIECLVSEDEKSCRAMALQLHSLNRERRGIQDRMQEQAEDAIEEIASSADQDLPAGLCLYNENWHPGVIGILASRIKDRLYRPVIAFARGEGGGLRGSARSIAGIHIRDVIDHIAATQPGLIKTFGGHAMAAGLTIPEQAYDDFLVLFNQEIENWFEKNGTASVIHSDGELAPEYLTLETAELIRAGGPWGQGFSEPAFDGTFEIMDRRVVGENHLKLQLRQRGTGSEIDAIAFHTTDHCWPEGTNSIYAVYRLDVNEYMDRRMPQLVLEYLEPITD